MTHSYAWHALFKCVTWLIHMRDMPHSNAWHDSFICVTCLIHMRDTTHSYVWHDSFICVTWLIHLNDIFTSNARTRVYSEFPIAIIVFALVVRMHLTNSLVRHDSVIYATWLIHMPHVTYSCPAHERVSIAIKSSTKGWRRLIGSLSCRSFSTKEPLNIGHFCRQWHIKIRDPMSLRHPVPSLDMNESCHVYEWVMSRIRMRHVAHMNESCDDYEGVSIAVKSATTIPVFAPVVCMRDMTQSYPRHDSHMRDILDHMRDMTLSFARHDSFIDVTWPIHVQCTKAYL